MHPPTIRKERDLLRRRFKSKFDVVMKQIHVSFRRCPNPVLNHPKWKKTSSINLVLTYDSRLDKASKTVKERMSSLYMDEKLCKIFLDPPLISFRINHNLRDLLVSARLPTPKTEEQNSEPGFYMNVLIRNAQWVSLLLLAISSLVLYTKQSLHISSLVNNAECNTLVKQLHHYILASLGTKVALSCTRELYKTPHW